VLHAHPFWNSPLSGWELPPDLRAELAGANLAISKGDAHFRRLTGDLHWPETAPFAQVMAYFPTRLVVLRVAKSMVQVGLAPGQPEALDQRDAAWRTNGRWGMIQFS
jgi:hypothetical protein